MKTTTLSIVCFLFLGFIFSCQENVKKEALITKPSKREARARIACGISYQFLYPDSDYGYNGDGCVTYFVHRGVTRQIKIKMSNITGAAQYTRMIVSFPNQPYYFQYSVASVTGGTTSYYAPPGGPGASIEWLANTLPAYTTYELILNVTGGTGPGSAENGVSLILADPCAPVQYTSCNDNENLHLVLVD